MHNGAQRSISPKINNQSIRAINANTGMNTIQFFRDGFAGAVAKPRRNMTPKH